MRGQHLVWLLGLVLGALVISAGCNQKTVLTFGKPSVIGVIAVSEDTVAGAEVEVGGSRLLPVVAVNSETLDLEGFSAAGEYLWNSSWEKEELRLGPGNKCLLHVYQSDGEAKSDSVVIPPPPHITEPAEGFVLLKGNPLTVTWATTPGVTQYHLEIDLDYSYYDTTGYYESFSLDTSWYLPGTAGSVTLAAATIFPADVDSVLYGDGEIFLSVEAGPRLGHESTGNIKGNGCGYFWTEAYAEDYFDIGSEGTGNSSRSRPKPADVARRLLNSKKAELESQ